MRPRTAFSGSVDRGWRVAPIPSRVGLYARVPEDGADVEHNAAVEHGADVEHSADVKHNADVKRDSETWSFARR
jgi:hypothetical protein